MVPQHIAFIMDGNGRWAKSKGKPRTFGHKQGSEVLKQICKDSYHLGVKYVTVYAFSTENWKRSEEEVSYLMNLLRLYLKESIKNAKENNMKVRVIGRRDDLASDIVESIEKMEAASKDFTGLVLTIALNYGGRDEILRGFKRYMETILEQNERLNNETIDLALVTQGVNTLSEDVFSHMLDTQGIPDPDLMIRTSGEWRTSNFLPWQLAYTEFYFTDSHWPDFDKHELEKAIRHYEHRNRRFGGVMDED
jgi:undecaprenyl diphosphate synthase